MTPAKESAEQWLSIHEACALLGVSAATLRRWSDASDLAAFTTPGGHRRFARSTLLSMLPPSPQEPPPLRRLGEAGRRLARVCRRNLSTACEDLPWTGGLSTGELVLLRRHGRTIATALVARLDADDARGRDVALADAVVAVSECGRIAGAHGISAQEAVETFLRFRRMFLTDLVDVVRRQRIGAYEVTDLVVTATETLDDLLLAMLSGYAAHSDVGEAS